MEHENIHLRHVMLYEFWKGVSVGTAQKNIQDIYLDRAPALRTVKKWFGRFRNGDFNMDDQPRSGRPSAIDDDIVSSLVENTLASSNVKRRAECVSLSLPVQSLSFDKPYVVPPRGDTGNWAPYGIQAELQGLGGGLPPDMQYAGPPVSRICLSAHEQTPSYGSNSTTALWSPSG